VNARGIVVYLVCAALVGLAATPTSALADASDDGQMTARWVSVRAPAVPHAVMIDGTWRTAGESYYRIDEHSDVAAYSLSLDTEIVRATQLKAIDPDSSAIPHLDQITALVRDSAADERKGELNGPRAAAYQVAIWHLTDNLPFDPDVVPDQTIRSHAAVLLAKSKAASDRIRQCTDPSCPTPLSTAATSARLDAKVGSTLDDAALRISIATTGGRYFDKPHYVNLRINGFGATLCAGEIDRVRIDRPPTHNVLDSSCSARRTDPDRKNDPATAGLPRLLVERISTVPTSQTANDTITAHIPRQASSQQVETTWSAGNDPGMVFLPTDASSPIITATRFTVTRVNIVTIESDDFASFQDVVQRSLLPYFTRGGISGLVLLFLLLILILLSKDFVVFIFKWLGKTVPQWSTKGWTWLRWRQAMRKARTDLAVRKPTKVAAGSSATSSRDGSTSADQARQGTQPPPQPPPPNAP
jgi:hypothetical protein